MSVSFFKADTRLHRRNMVLTVCEIKVWVAKRKYSGKIEELNPNYSLGGA